MSVLEEVLTDLTAEGAYVEALVATLDEDGWRRPTPAEGWDVATTIAHLLWTDESSVVAVDATLAGPDSPEKKAWDDIVTLALEDPTGFVDTAALGIARELSGGELLTRWRTSRQAIVARLRDVPDGQRLMWFGPPMSAASMATARLMETWAHGIDVADALGEDHSPTDRIKHVASIGYRTRDFAYANNGLQPPAEPFRLELTAPSGDTWSWGPEDGDGSVQTVRGSAYDFCRLVTQRVHRDDTDLVATGPDAEKWLTIAQAFAGPAGGGRPKA